ncbi:PfkB family carbohydrate kinase [bacterium]|nr:PfkB family carbohydrate kinase [bacterium]
MQLGGVTTYAGLTFKKHGLESVIVSNIAPADTYIINFFNRQQITLHSDKTEKTTTFINRYDGDQRIQELVACSETIAATQVLKFINNVNHIHLGPLYPNDIDPELFLSIPKSKIVSCDLQGLVRFVEKCEIHLEGSPHLTKALTCSDIIKMDEKELETIQNSLKISLTRLQKQFNIKEMVVTKSKKGGTIYSESGKKIDYKSYPLENIGDTTGAGDVFFAVYLFARLYRKQPILKSSHYASSIVAKQIEGKYILPQQLQSIINPIHASIKENHSI